MKKRDSEALLEGYAAIAASVEFQEEHRRKLALRDKWKKVAEFEKQFNVDIRTLLEAETTKRTKAAARRKK